MSAAGITDTVVKAIEEGEFDAIIMNYANADMGGHSGKLEAAIQAVEAVDAGLARIYQALKPRGGVWIITADHGKCGDDDRSANGGRTRITQRIRCRLFWSVMMTNCA